MPRNTTNHDRLTPATGRLASGRLAPLAACLAFASPSLAQSVMAPPEGFETFELTGNDKTLSCMTGGAGPAMLLLHGWPQTATEWKPVLAALSAEHRVIACDMPGVRASTNVDADYTKAGIADDIHAAIDGLDLGAVHLVGHDIGMMVAYAYASAFPDDVATLTLMDAPLPGTKAFDAIASNPSAWHFSFHRVKDVPEGVVGNSVEFYVRHFMTELWADSAGPPDDVIAASVAAYSDPDTLHTGFEWYRAFEQDAKDNALTLATPLAMPVLALNAGAISPRPYVLEMMRPLAGDVTGGAIEGAGHWLTEEAPDEVSARILEFLTEVSAREVPAR